MESFHHEDTQELYDKYVLKNYAPAPLTLVRGEGVYVWDSDGRRYLDFGAGIAVSALGHGHPAWVAAIKEQLFRLTHVSNLYRNRNQGRLAKNLVSRCGPGRVFFCNSGAEANEALLKLARLHGVHKAGREGVCYKVVTALNGFHGRTFGGMSATGQEKIRQNFAPLLPGFSFGKLNDLADFERLIDPETAAVFLETIQGEGGIHPCTVEFLQGIRDLCDQRGVLLILDEVQCGIGRTGRFFAYEKAGIRPDAIGMAKGLGSGFPLGAIWVDEKYADLFTPGSHGTTFGGTPLGCAAGLATLHVIEKELLMENVGSNAPGWLANLQTVRDEFPDQVLSVRGEGYMVGVQLAMNPLPTVAAMRDRGMLAVPASGDVIRFLPPLIATAEHLRQSTEIFRDALAATA
jgi:acetylornithine/N-succinyldiaminopimelate aminotransferase